jgi:hypothetical protein
MGGAGRPTVAIDPTDEERETLVRWSRRPWSSQALALRSRDRAGLRDGRPNTNIADELGCDSATRSSKAVVVETLETTSKGATHWSTRSMAQRPPPVAAAVYAVDEKPQIQALAQDIRDWVETWNDNPRPFTWHNSPRRSSTDSPATAAPSTTSQRSNLTGH